MEELRPELAAADRFGHCESVTSEQIDVVKDQRRKSCNIVRADRISLTGKLFESGVDKACSTE